MLVYDITDKNSFLNIRNWMDQIQNHADNNVNKILIGNKFDLAQKRVSIFYILK
jgi:Ras-related protein Rab-8A